MISVEAIEAVATRVYPGWQNSPADWQDYFRRKATEALEAAAPHLIASRKPKLGEGDYAPSWNDRKRLAEVWQSKAPLPEEGLSACVYEALIEVAAWGYQQRADEDL